MDATEVPEVPQPHSEPSRPRRLPRRVTLIAGLVVTLLIGVGIGAAAKSSGISQATYNASQASVSSLTGQVSSLEIQVSSLKSDVSTLQADVSSDNAAVTTAQTKAATAKQTAEDSLKSQEQQVASEQKTLQQELGEVQASSIDSDGTYVVGQDVKPGTYHTSGSGNVGANDCYYATLSSTDGSLNSIISNGNFDGPETISLSGVYAFQINGSCTWVRVP
jgi:cytoskeletal protein RodZ